MNSTSSTTDPFGTSLHEDLSLRLHTLWFWSSNQYPIHFINHRISVFLIASEVGGVRLCGVPWQSRNYTRLRPHNLSSYQEKPIGYGRRICGDETHGHRSKWDCPSQRRHDTVSNDWRAIYKPENDGTMVVRKVQLCSPVLHIGHTFAILLSSGTTPLSSALLVLSTVARDGKLHHPLYE